MERFTLQTKYKDMIELTPTIKDLVAHSGIETGLCIVSCTHTTASLCITSFWDPKGHEDIQDELAKLIPNRLDFRHEDSLTDASGHIKSALVGTTLNIVIEGGKLLLGHSQGIFFAEFDGPRPREYFVKVINES